MKRYTLALLTILAFCLAVAAQTPSDTETLKQVNQRLLESYNAKDYDKALDLARQILDLNIKIFGAQSRETAIAHANLGRLYSLKEKRREAVENYEKALKIYQKDAPKYAENIAALRLNIANVLMSDPYSLDREKSEKTEQMYLQSLAILENKYGKDSKEILPLLKALTEFYAYRSREDAKLVDKGQEFFIRYYLANVKHNTADKDALQAIEDSFLCFLSSSVSSPKQAAEREKQFTEAVKDMRKPEDEPVIVRGMAVNGKAVRLEKPEYPGAARAVRAGGSVMVRVLIDEQGNVIKTSAFCGHPLLRAASAEAASKAKFSPTLQDGKPVKVVGIIVYNFVP